MRRRVLLVTTWIVLAIGVARAEVIDRIVAVVDGALITQSDVTAAIRLGFVYPPAAVVDRLIERLLMLKEVDRYAPPDPAEAVVDRAVAGIRDRAGSPAQFDAILLQTGIGFDQIRRNARDDLRIESYLQQRFGAIQPTDDEMREYYREHAAEFSQGAVLRPFEEAREVVKAALVAERRAATIRDWLTELRRRANVNILLR
jgi:peptidyl-prolyl cis-trans isomerase SurA